jgi:hypothetical protein
LQVGPDVGGLILKEEKVKQEVPRGSQATSFEVCNPEQGKPGAYRAYRSNMTYFILFLLHVMYLYITYRVLLIDDDRLLGSTLLYINLP